MIALELRFQADNLIRLTFLNPVVSGVKLTYFVTSYNLSSSRKGHQMSDHRVDVKSTSELDQLQV